MRYDLKPFGALEGITECLISIECDATLNESLGKLELSYKLKHSSSVAEDSVKIPKTGSSSGSGVRRDGLWEHTCFEAFIGCVDDAGYYEFNLSPSKDWQCYRFEAYRSRAEADELPYSEPLILSVVQSSNSSSITSENGNEEELTLGCVIDLELLPALGFAKHQDKHKDKGETSSSSSSGSGSGCGSK